MIQASIRETLLGWQDSFIGRKKKSVENDTFVSLSDNLEGEK